MPETDTVSKEAETPDGSTMMPNESMLPGETGASFSKRARKLLTIFNRCQKKLSSDNPAPTILPANTQVTEYTVLPDGVRLQDRVIQQYLITVRYHHGDKYCLFNQNRRWNGKYWSPILDRLYPESAFLFPREEALMIASSVINKITYYGMTYKEYANRD